MDKYLKISEAARLLGISPMYLWSQSKKGFVPSHKLGERKDGKRKWGWLREEVLEFQNKKEEKKKLLKSQERRRKIASCLKQMDILEQRLEKLNKEV